MPDNLRTVALDDDAWGAEPPPYSSTTVEDPESGKNAEFNKAYLFSVEGAMKLIEIVSNMKITVIHLT